MPGTTWCPGLTTILPAVQWEGTINQMGELSLKKLDQDLPKSYSSVVLVASQLCRVADSSTVTSVLFTGVSGNEAVKIGWGQSIEGYIFQAKEFAINPLGNEETLKLSGQWNGMIKVRFRMILFQL